MTRLAEMTNIPVVTTIMGKGALPSSHPSTLEISEFMDVMPPTLPSATVTSLFSIGTRFNDRITGKIGDFAKNASIVHIDIDSASISRNIAVDVPIVSDAKRQSSPFLKRPARCVLKNGSRTIDGWKREHPLKTERPGLTPQRIIQSINRIFDRAIIATDVGQNQLWATQFLELGEGRKMLTSGGLGTMGYGFPAAIGAKAGNPDTDVIVISGDGGFQMNVQEMATAVAYELPVIICIFNNGYLGNVRQWQEMFFDRHYSSTCIQRRKAVPSPAIPG